MVTLLEQVINELKLSKASTGNKLTKVKVWGELKPGDFCYHYNSTFDELTEFKVIKITPPKNKGERYEILKSVNAVAEGFFKGGTLDKSKKTFYGFRKHTLLVSESEMFCSNLLYRTSENDFSGYSTSIDEIMTFMDQFKY